MQCGTGSRRRTTISNRCLYGADKDLWEENDAKSCMNEAIVDSANVGGKKEYTVTILIQVIYV